MNPKINLQYYRELKGLSQKELARRLGISQGYISAIELNKKSPTIRMLFRISSELDVCTRMMLGCTIDCEHCTKSTKCKCKCKI